MPKKKLDRRDFLQKAAGVTAIASLPVAAAAKADQSAKWDEETDVVVVGSGVAGYGAAVEAADAGARVLLIDKEDWWGGTALLSGGHMQVPDSHVQRAAGIKDKKDWAFEDVMKMGEYRNSPELVRSYVDNAAETALWLEKLGIVYKKVPARQHGSRVARTLTPAPSPNYPAARGISIMHVLNRRALALKVEVRLSTKLTRLMRDEGGAVTGLEVETGGKTRRIRAKRGVVIATGGYKSNYQMMRALDPRLDEPFVWNGYPHTHDVGEGHIAAQNVGAGFVDMSQMCFVFWTIGGHYFVWWEKGKDPVYGGLDWKTENAPFMILVDNEGNRFANEVTFDNNYGSYRGELVDAFLNMKKRPRKMWMILDTDGMKATGWNAEYFTKVPAQNNLGLEQGMLVTAPNVKELAKKAGLPAANLEATIQRYNSNIQKHHDSDFHRPEPYHYIEHPPFYAAEVILNFGDQAGGIRINSRMEVIDHDKQIRAGIKKSVPLDKESVIPGLYAAGECTGGTFGLERGHGKMICYLVHGRIAGKNAARRKA